MRQYEDHFGVGCDIKFCRDVLQLKVVHNQKGDEVGGRLFPECGVEEKI